MSIRTRGIPILGALFLLTGVLALSAQAPDNTANNKQPGIAADQQSNTASDRMITQNIRKALMADKSLSTYAHNVKIITRDGMVTLKGPVKSEDEKQKVIAAATRVVHAKQIDDELTVKSD
ncbi:MAG TPA: BON domain-containing protein [Terracidiphilus sp.]|nr:BON domain-containing protein [Terracidiphilus sp.]